MQKGKYNRHRRLLGTVRKIKELHQQKDDGRPIDSKHILFLIGMTAQYRARHLPDSSA
jgi:hypothetical protein